MSKKVFFKPKKVAVAVAATLLTSAVAIAGINSILDDNFWIDQNAVPNRLTYIFPRLLAAGEVPDAAEANGYLVIDEAELVVEPGIDVYQEGYRSGDTTFNGCIMAAKSLNPVINSEFCRATPDSGKRFKLRGVKINQPIDFEFEVATVNQELPLLYNVYGKLTNDIPGTKATGWVVQVGKGVGAGFVPSTATDGVALKPIQDFMGKFPGGLFGGSPAEGLPYFTLESAYFNPNPAVTGDILATNGVPSQYTGLFPGGWMTEADVPVAWFYDIDGKAWTDDKLQAWQATTGEWLRITKTWKTDDIFLVLGDFIEANNQDPIDLSLLPDELNPLKNPYVNIAELTAWMNDEAGLTGADKAIRDQQVVGELLEWLVLSSPTPVDPAVLADWAANPSTIRYSDTFVGSEPTPQDAFNWPVVATFKPDCGIEGLYVLEGVYVNEPKFDAIKVIDPTCGAAVEADLMATVVNDNTNLPGGNDYYFGIPGYTKGTIEDLSNVNTFYAIEVDPTASPEGTTKFTMRIVFTDDTVNPPPPDDGGDDGDTGGDTGGDDDGGCTVGNSNRFDPIFPALVAMGLGYFGLRRFKASK
jgi:hypothetical protein